MYWRLGHRSALLHRPGQALGGRPNRDRSIGALLTTWGLGLAWGHHPGRALGWCQRVVRLQLPWGGACRIRSALSVRCCVSVRRRRWGGGKYGGVVKDMKVGGGGNWPIKLRLECYLRSAIVPAARQNRQPSFDDVRKGANLRSTFCLRARNTIVGSCALGAGATVHYVRRGCGPVCYSAKSRPLSFDLVWQRAHRCHSWK